MAAKRSKIGNLMYNTLMKQSKFLIKHKWLIYFLNYTWGIIWTTIGWIVYLFTKIFTKAKGEKFLHMRILITGNNWGGFELGMAALVADKMGEAWTLHTKCHETGHSFQNALLGPFSIFLCIIPSAIRYHYRNHLSKKGKKLNDYDLIWFEGMATDIGYYYYSLGDEK